MKYLRFGQINGKGLIWAGEEWIWAQWNFGILDFGYLFKFKGIQKTKRVSKSEYSSMLVRFWFDFRVPSNYRRLVGMNEFRMVFVVGKNCGLCERPVGSTWVLYQNGPPICWVKFVTLLVRCCTLTNTT